MELFQSVKMHYSFKNLKKKIKKKKKNYKKLSKQCVITRFLLLN